MHRKLLEEFNSKIYKKYNMNDKNKWNQLYYFNFIFFVILIIISIIYYLNKKWFY